MSANPFEYYELRITGNRGPSVRVLHPLLPPAGVDPTDHRVPMDVRLWAAECVRAMARIEGRSLRQSPPPPAPPAGAAGSPSPATQGSCP